MFSYAECRDLCIVILSVAMLNVEAAKKFSKVVFTLWRKSL